MCVSSCKSVHTRYLTGAFYYRPEGTAAVAFAFCIILLHISLPPPTFPHFLPSIYSSHIFSFSPAFIYLTVASSLNADQSLHPLLILLFLTVSLTSTLYQAHLPIFSFSFCQKLRQLQIYGFICCQFTFIFSSDIQLATCQE